MSLYIMEGIADFYKGYEKVLSVIGTPVFMLYGAGKKAYAKSLEKRLEATATLFFSQHSKAIVNIKQKINDRKFTKEDVADLKIAKQFLEILVKRENARIEKHRANQLMTPFSGLSLYSASSLISENLSIQTEALDVIEKSLVKLEK